MAELARLFENNKKWVAEQAAADPQYFERLAATANSEVLVDRLLRQPRSRYLAWSPVKS